MRRALVFLGLIALLGASEAQAEFRQIDLTIFGMD
jgi:hypothetical protein